MKKIFTISIVVLIYSMSFSQTQCVSLSGYNNAYLDSVSMNNVTYPPGSAFITSGNIQYIKPHIGNMYQFITGDSLWYVGDIDINVSTSNCTNRTLTFSVAYLIGLAIDGDTIFSNLNPPASYSGNGFNMTQDGQGHYTVTGNFNVVSLYSSTNILSNVCLVCEASVGIQMSNINVNQIEIYPNPTDNLLNLQVGNENIGQMFLIFDYTGKLVSSGKLNQKLNQINTTNLNSGLYFLRVNDLRSNKVIKFIRN